MPPDAAPRQPAPTAGVPGMIAGAPRRRPVVARALAGVAIVLVAVLVTVGAVVGWLAWRAAQPPRAVLPAAAGPVTVLDSLAHPDPRPDPRPGRRLVELRLDGGRLGPIGLALSLPAGPPPARGWPVILVLGGLGTGRANLAPIPEAGPNALAGFDWPFLAAPLPPGPAALPHLPKLYRQVLATPGQIAAALDWLAGQPWADPTRVSLLGFSLGALAAPAAQAVAAAAHGRRVGWTILAYGGAPFGALIAAHPALPAGLPARAVGALADLVLAPLQPLRHLPELDGRFLVLGGRTDRLIPAAAARALAAATPDPKDIILFDGDHMGVGPGQRRLLDRIITTSRQWLIDQGAVRVSTERSSAPATPFPPSASHATKQMSPRLARSSPDRGRT